MILYTTGSIDALRALGVEKNAALIRPRQFGESGEDNYVLNNPRIPHELKQDYYRQHLQDIADTPIDSPEEYVRDTRRGTTLGGAVLGGIAGTVGGARIHGTLRSSALSGLGGAALGALGGYGIGSPLGRMSHYDDTALVADAQKTLSDPARLSNKLLREMGRSEKEHEEVMQQRINSKEMMDRIREDIKRREILNTISNFAPNRQSDI